MFILPGFQSVTTYPTAGALWTPASVSSFAWWDFGDISQTTIVSSAFSQVNDKSGNTRHITQTTTAARPAVSTVNGLNSALFDGVDDSLTIATLSSNFTAYHLFAIVLYTGLTTSSKTNRIFAATGSATGDTAANSFALIRPGSTSNIAAFNSSATVRAPTPFTATSWAIISSFHDGNQNSNAVNGNSPATAANAFGTKAIGRAFVGRGSANYWVGNIAEILLFPAQQTIDITQRIEGYLAHKWGVAANLASGHPYKASPPRI